MLLTGEYKHTIDTKKRLALPSKFRKELGKTVVITKETNSCLVVYTEKGWKSIADKLAGLSNAKDEARRFVRLKLAGAMSVNIDKLGRILVPDYLKEYAGLKKDVIISGLSNRVEIWDSKNWEIYKKESEKNMDTLVSKLEELGI
ncbi:MAG: division/cell wall cluster transcriptional repressor MraZ [Patescibacteria group bacterium]|nr:division/cell wall cluster transcriptional repressor MraZ [Patescibacteria group bacterium]